MSTIIIKNSATSGSVPPSLVQGEFAVNVTDGRIFYGSGSGNVVKEFVAGTTINTGSFATTGSNTFFGNQIVNGNLTVNGTASLAYLNVTYESASIIYSSGSNQFGDAANDTQTLWGTVDVKTGPLLVTGSLLATGSVNITGSTTQRGNNTLIGNTTISGSLTISSSQGITPATFQIDGDILQTGRHRFNPVTTTIDSSISASYIYVSGSTNDLYFTQNGNGYSNTTRLRWLEGNLYTGLLHGGVISAATGSTTFNVSSGSGIIVTLNATTNQDPYPTIQFVNWNSFTSQSINNLTTAIQTYVGIDSAGNIIQQTEPWNNGQYNTSISLGTVIHQNLATVNATITYPNVAYGYKQRTYDFIKAFGPLKLSGYTLSTSSSLGLRVGSGSAFADGRNYEINPNEPSYIVDPGTAVSKIFRYYQSGSSFVQDTNGGVGYTGIDSTQYNLNGTGVLTGVSPSKFYVQRVFWYPNSATKGIVAYYGLAEYGTLDEAELNYRNEPFLETPNTAQNAVFLGLIIIKGNANFTNANDYRIIQSGLFRAAGLGGGGAAGGGATTLSALTDVTLSTLSYGDLLMYDTTTWINTKTLSGSYTLSGSLKTNDGVSVSSLTASFVSASSITGSLFGTASWANNAITASYILNAISSSFATTASYALNALSSSFATSASYIDCGFY